MPSGQGLLREKQVAQELGLSVRALQAWRSKGVGPVYLKLGRSVRYRREDLEAFMEAGRREGGEVEAEK